MPLFTISLYWINFGDINFEGEGTAEKPYLIKTAEQLAGLAYLLYSDNYYAFYAGKYYELANDIDLSGKIWTGIGSTKYLFSEVQAGSRKMEEGWLYPFEGVFDGKGHTIFNLTSFGAMIVDKANESGTYYYLNSFSPALFGLTSAGAEIRNVTLENANINGSLASGVVGEVMDNLTMENVNVIGGEISSTDIAGGLIGRIAGATDRTQGHIYINDCFVDSNINGRIVGGAVGYILRTYRFDSTMVVINNFMFRGNIRATGESVLETSEDDYLRPVAGGVVGVALADYLYLRNCIVLGDVSAYNYPSLVGGFIGCVGKDEDYAANNVVIGLMGCKLTAVVGSIYENNSAGVILGGIHPGYTGNVKITASENNHTNLDAGMVFYNGVGVKLTTDSKFVLSADSAYESGDFDYYNTEYYQDATYFDLSKQWSTEDIDRMYVTVTFVYYDGEQLNTTAIKLKFGESVENAPESDRAPSRQYVYTFDGWDKSIENLKHSQTVHATYVVNLREYNVNYYDESGNLIETRVRAYGSNIEQNVEAPEKKGNFFFSYRFDRWGSKGQMVDGNLDLKPTYTRSITFAGFVTIFALVAGVIAILAAVVFIVKRKQIFGKK